mmetsp:Transcript_16835/g.37918  ORF Transcript_16835/g.37918 Transcript_16835/m.37918 type:complete len:905 (+) Transcript_16835:175-2889(+)
MQAVRRASVSALLALFFALIFSQQGSLPVHALLSPQRHQHLSPRSPTFTGHQSRLLHARAVIRNPQSQTALYNDISLGKQQEQLQEQQEQQEQHQSKRWTAAGLLQQRWRDRWSQWRSKAVRGGLKGARQLTLCVVLVLISAKQALAAGLGTPARSSAATSPAGIHARARPSQSAASNRVHTKKVGVDLVVGGEGREAGSLVAYDRPDLETDSLDKVALKEMIRSWKKLERSLHGPKQDTLIMLIATSIIIPLFTSLETSPIVGFMLLGTLLGPSALNWVKDVHMVDKLGELGIVFFLFEMGLELSLDRLKAMRKDVFGIGIGQFLLTMLAGTGISLACGVAPTAAVTIGGSLSLSSSAFVLQLLKDKNAMGTRYGRASFGVLLLQDLAVVPLLIVVELLGKGGAGLGKALGIAAVKAIVTLTTMSLMGRKLLNPVFSLVAKSGSQEAFLSVILSTVLLMSFVTSGIGLSDTLGAFLAGLLLSETSYRYQVEADIAPFRGLLLGLFFITVGFSIDLGLMRTDFATILAMLFTMIAGKATITTLVARLFGVSLAAAQRTGLLTAQGGELAFVAIGIGSRSGMISPKLSKLLLTTVALSMAGTPILAWMGTTIAANIEKDTGFSQYSAGLPSIPKEETKVQKDFVFICGYGRVGQMVCEMLDRQCVPYVVLEKSPQRVIEARNQGLPVYYGDIERPELLKGFHVEDARACVLTLEDMSATNKAVIRMRKLYPTMPIIMRAKNAQHKSRLEGMFDNVVAMAPVLPEDSVLLTLPFAGAVLRNIGVSRPEIEALMEETRKLHLDDEENQDNVIFGRVDRRREDSQSPEDDSGEGIIPVSSAAPREDVVVPSASEVEAGGFSGDAFDIREIKDGLVFAERERESVPGGVVTAPEILQAPDVDMHMEGDA